ncbi:uncharacterized protein L969DRAFT_141971 [Mixia osmundae IAM 14324]|uniref:Uncharacterized protein n=1 Tax=Mixia osmundae (strain CBS 9802 / IAM 14324 / JCM 22182 / KY 12970) TaxID=764103 RepID=G7E0D2_MIXOS|nr:uncharacterized protein L969DRAFT_141971 [Mixia osmundae IAM 14324]KEI42284.1 hypothetical protein L969DRAFT_141971 [Mixia osmundae IAM 14324]GAA96292.1 hypothetical protein E5Q_02958 [Mixia osmundae IAM 14324]
MRRSARVYGALIRCRACDDVAVQRRRGESARSSRTTPFSTAIGLGRLLSQRRCSHELSTRPCCEIGDTPNDARRALAFPTFSHKTFDKHA